MSSVDRNGGSQPCADSKRMRPRFLRSAACRLSSRRRTTCSTSTSGAVRSWRSVRRWTSRSIWARLCARRHWRPGNSPAPMVFSRRSAPAIPGAHPSSPWASRRTRNCSGRFPRTCGVPIVVGRPIAPPGMTRRRTTPCVLDRVLPSTASRIAERSRGLPRVCRSSPTAVSSTVHVGRAGIGRSPRPHTQPSMESALPGGDPSRRTTRASAMRTRTE